MNIYGAIGFWGTQVLAPLQDERTNARKFCATLYARLSLRNLGGIARDPHKRLATTQKIAIFSSCDDDASVRVCGASSSLYMCVKCLSSSLHGTCSLASFWGGRRDVRRTRRDATDDVCHVCIVGVLVSVFLCRYDADASILTNAYRDLFFIVLEVIFLNGICGNKSIADCVCGKCQHNANS